jgi:TRAP-type uncharacterized transport system substrate-binding protein
MQSTIARRALATAKRVGTAGAQTYGFATLQPGTLNHTTASAVAKVPDDVVYKVIETMEANKADMIAIAPNLREFSAAGLNKKNDFAYHPGALKYFKEEKIEAKAF